VRGRIPPITSSWGPTSREIRSSRPSPCCASLGGRLDPTRRSPHEASHRGRLPHPRRRPSVPAAENGPGRCTAPGSAMVALFEAAQPLAGPAGPAAPLGDASSGEGPPAETSSSPDPGAPRPRDRLGTATTARTNGPLAAGDGPQTARGPLFWWPPAVGRGWTGIGLGKLSVHQPRTPLRVPRPRKGRRIPVICAPADGCGPHQGMSPGQIRSSDHVSAITMAKWWPATDPRRSALKGGGPTYDAVPDVVYTDPQAGHAVVLATRRPVQRHAFLHLPRGGPRLRTYTAPNTPESNGF